MPLAVRALGAQSTREPNGGRPMQRALPLRVESRAALSPYLRQPLIGGRGHTDRVIRRYRVATHILYDRGSG